MKWFYLSLCLIFFCVRVWADDWQKDPKLQAEMKKMLSQYLKKEKLRVQNFPLLSQKSSGLFLTLEEGDTVLFCLGDIRAHSSHLFDELAHLLEKTFETPHEEKEILPLRGKEKRLWIRFPGPPQRIRSLTEIDIRSEGVLLKSDQKASIALPGEVMNKNYLIRLLKRKAGLNKEERFTLYRIPTYGFSILLRPEE